MSLADKVLAVNDDLPIRTDAPVHSGKVRSVYWLTAADSARLVLERGYDVAPDAPLAIMVISDRISAFDCIWHAEGGMRPMLFDLQEDPDEFHDLSKGSEHNDVIDKLYLDLRNWGLRMSQRVTKSESDIIAMRGLSLRRGILSFLVDGSEVSDELTEKYRGPIRQDHTKD